MNFKIEPWKHQLEAMHRAGLLHDYALFFEQGTGKTSTAINILRGKFNEAGRFLRTIIFTLPLPIPQWRQEWLDHTSISPKLIVPLYGSGKKRLKTFMDNAYEHSATVSKVDVEKKIITLNGNPPKPKECVFITNYESLLMKDLFKEFMDWKPEAVVFDESHKCKSPSTARSKQAFELANPYDRPNKRRLPKPNTLILTGTPVLNKPMDLFQQFKILDGGDTFGWNFYVFRARFFRDRNAGMPKDKYFPMWEIMTTEKDGFDAEKEIQQLIAAKSMRVLKEDCLDLPPEVSVTIKVGMSKEQKRVYDELREDLVTYYNSKACVASLAIVKALRLMQIASGYIPLQNETDAEQVLAPLPGTPKEAALRELIQEIAVEQEQKVLVWAVFKQNYELIKNVCIDLGVEFVEVHGGISESKKRANVANFKTREGPRVFVGHPGSGGIGLNLTIAPYSIFYSRNFSLEHFLQARARNHRGGSREAGHTKITHYDLVCEGTIDEMAVAKLAAKEDMSARLLADMVLRG